MQRWLIIAFVLLLASAARAEPPTPQALAKRLDELLTKEHKVHKVQPAAPSGRC